MAVKEKKPKGRESKQSNGSARGARKTRLTPIQKILMVNGGMAHGRLRGNQKLGSKPTRAQQTQEALD